MCRRALEDDTEIFAIFEDDIMLASSPREVNCRVKQAIQQLPPTADMLYLEACHEDCSSLRHAGSKRPNLVKAHAPYCSAGIIFTRKGARQMIQLLTPVRGIIDGIYSESIGGGLIEAYIASPLAFFQDLVFNCTTPVDKPPLPPDMHVTTPHRIGKGVCQEYDAPFEEFDLEIFFAGRIVERDPELQVEIEGKRTLSVSLPNYGLHYGKWRVLEEGWAVVYFCDEVQYDDTPASRKTNSFPLQVGIWEPGVMGESEFILKFPEGSVCFSLDMTGGACGVHMVLENDEFEEVETYYRIFFIK